MRSWAAGLAGAFLVCLATVSGCTEEQVIAPESFELSGHLTAGDFKATGRAYILPSDDFAYVVITPANASDPVRTSGFQYYRGQYIWFWTNDKGTRSCTVIRRPEIRAGIFAEGLTERSALPKLEEFGAFRVKNEQGAEFAFFNFSRSTTPVFFKIDDTRSTAAFFADRISKDACPAREEDDLALPGDDWIESNRSWTGGEESHKSKAWQLTVVDLAYSIFVCLIFHADKCVIDEHGERYGYWCGVRRGGSEYVMSPVDFTCKLHDQGIYGPCGFHHAAYCFKHYKHLPFVPDNLFLYIEKRARSRIIAREAKNCAASKGKKISELLLPNCQK